MIYVMEIIAQQQAVGKPFWERVPEGTLTVLVVVLASAASFGLGVLAGKDMGQDQGPLRIENAGAALPAAVSAATPTAHISSTKPQVAEAPVATVKTSGTYVASKNGTKFYLPTCGSAKRIKDENKVWFDTKEEAEAAGFTPAANCPGL